MGFAAEGKRERELLRWRTILSLCALTQRDSRDERLSFFMRKKFCFNILLKCIILVWSEMNTLNSVSEVCRKKEIHTNTSFECHQFNI